MVTTPDVKNSVFINSVLNLSYVCSISVMLTITLRPATCLPTDEEAANHRDVQNKTNGYNMAAGNGSVSGSDEDKSEKRHKKV